jgi:hypothetical protein
MHTGGKSRGSVAQIFAEITENQGFPDKIAKGVPYFGFFFPFY